MDVPASLKVVYLDARFRHGLGVRRSLVSQRIELAGDHHGRRQSSEACRSERCCPWVEALRRTLRVRRINVLIPEPRHQRSGEGPAFTVFGIGRSCEVTVCHRGQQELPHELGTMGIACHLGHHGGEVSTGAPARHGQLALDETEQRCIGRHPLHGCESVVHGGRELRFGRMPIVDRHHRHVSARTQISTERIIGVVSTKHPATTVEIHHSRMRAGATRTIEAICQLPSGAREEPINDLANVWTRRPNGRGGSHEVAGGGGRHGFDRRKFHGLHHFQHDGDVGLEAPDDAIVDNGRVRSTASESEVIVGDHLIAYAPVAVDATRIGKKYPGLPRYVCAHVPGVRSWHEGDGSKVVDVLNPSVNRSRGWFDDIEVISAQINEAINNPIDVLLDGYDHVGQYRRTSGTGDHEEVGETFGHQPEVRGGSGRPRFTKGHPVAPSDVDRHHGTGHCVKAGGEHDGVERHGFLGHVNTGFGDGDYGILA